MDPCTRLILTVIFLLICSISAGQESTPAEKGVLDLSGIVFNEKTYLRLNGEWEFYWKQFPDPADFETDHPPTPTLYGKVPSYWKDYEHPGIEFSGQGFASYRLIVILPERRSGAIALDIPVFDVAYRIFLNGQEVSSAGQTGRTRGESQAGYLTKRVMINTDSDSLSILIHVSNFQHRRGGFWRPMHLGHQTIISQVQHRYKLISDAALGFLAAFILFFLFFYFMYREEHILIVFSMVLAGVFIRMMNTGDFPVQMVFDIPWIWMIRLEYLGTFIAFGFAAWYFQILFPSRIGMWMNRIIGAVTILACALTLLFDPPVFAFTMLYFQPAVFLLLGYYLVLCIRSSLKGKRKDLIFLAGLVIFIAALINDVFIANSLTTVSKDYAVHFALLIFVLLQAIIIIRSWIMTYREKERLMAEIEDININLERRVTERTSELNTRNREIESRNEELRKTLEFKNRVFSIIAHDLKSPVANLVQNSALMDLDLSDEESGKLFKSFREQSRSALNLIDNLLYWGRSQGAQLSIKPEIHELKGIISKVLDPLSKAANSKNIRIEQFFSPSTKAYADRELIEIVIRNLISNAIKFTEYGGTIQISIDAGEEAGTLALRIKDNGTGMSDSEIENVLGEKDIISKPGTENEKGTGLGLRLCLDLVRANNGTMKITSRENEGTEILVILPGQEKTRD